MKKRIYLFLSLLIAAQLPAMASVNDLIRQVLENNQGLVATRLDMESDVMSRRTENNLYDPEVEVEYLAKEMPSTEVTISETFEWPGVYTARSKALKHRISAMEYLYESKKVETVRDAMLIYVDIVNVNRQIARKRQILNVSDSILNKISATALRSGFTVLDRTRLRLEAFDAKAEIGQLTVHRQVLCDELARLNGGKSFENVDLTATEFSSNLLPIGDYLTAYSNSAEMKAAVAGTTALNYDIKAASAARLPNIKVGYKFLREDGISSHGGVFGISIPIFSNRGKSKAVRAAAGAQSFSVDYTRQYGESKIRTQYTEVVELASQISEYEKIINADEVLSYLNSSLGQHSITMVDYLAEYQYLISALSKLDEMRYDYDTKFVELSKYLLIESNY